MTNRSTGGMHPPYEGIWRACACKGIEWFSSRSVFPAAAKSLADPYAGLCIAYLFAVVSSCCCSQIDSCIYFAFFSTVSTKSLLQELSVSILILQHWMPIKDYQRSFLGWIFISDSLYLCGILINICNNPGKIIFAGVALWRDYTISSQ